MKEEKKQDSDEVDLSKAKESKAHRFSLVWVIPIIAFIVFVILLWNNSLTKHKARLLNKRALLVG